MLAWLYIIVSNFIGLVLMGLIIGFSPVLYGVVAGLLGLAKPKRFILSYALVGGIVVAVFVLLIFGNALASYSLHHFFSQENEFYPLIVGGLGGCLIIYACINLFIKPRSQQIQLPRPTKGRHATMSQAVGLFGLGLVKTIASISGIGAAILVSTALASRGTPWFGIIIAAIILCAAAIFPFIVFISGERFFPRTYQRTMALFASFKTKRQRYHRLTQFVLLSGGIVLVSYTISLLS